MEATLRILTDETKELDNAAQDERLAAIRRILVGKQLEQFERKVTNMLRRSEGGNQQLYKLVNQLSHEVQALQKQKRSTKPTAGEMGSSEEFNEADLNAALSALPSGDDAGVNFEAMDTKENLGNSEKNNLTQNILQLLKNSNRQTGHLQQRVEQNDRQLEQLMKLNRQELRLLEAELQSSQKQFQEEQAKNQQRWGRMDSFLEKEDQFEERLQAIESHYKQFKSLGAEAFEAKLQAQSHTLRQEIQASEERMSSKQEAFQGDMQTLLESMAAKISERFQQSGQRQDQLEARLNSKLNQGPSLQQIQALERELNQVQELLNTDMVSFFEKSKARQDQSIAKMQDFQNQIVSKLEGLEQRLEGQSPASQNPAPAAAKPSLKDTLSRLNALLGDE